MASQPAAAPSLSEPQWVEAELVRSLMRNARNTQYIPLLLVPVFIGVLAGDVHWATLAAWAVLALAVVAYRIRLLHRFAVQPGPEPISPADTARLVTRYADASRLLALLWGLTAALHFDRAPLADQFLCWLMIAGVGMFAVNSFSVHLRTLNSYINTLALTVIAVMLWHIVVALELQGPAHHYWLLVLVVIYWQLLLEAARRLHSTNRRNFELQYRNTQLIESLTRQTQAALDAVQIKNRFLASAAHDIRQPVHALGLYADWLRSEPELVHEIAPKIVESTKAVNALFDSLFDLVRLDSGKIRINVEPVAVETVLGELELHYRPLAQAKGLDFRLRVTPGRVMTDLIILQRILGNLIANAVSYTHRGGILVASRRTARGMRVEIWDTGIGIPPDQQPRIFHEFYKVPTHPGTEEGFGLGLAIVHRLTDILGYPLSLKSRVGRGTVFRLELPPVDEEKARERAAAAVAQLVSRP